MTGDTRKVFSGSAIYTGTSLLTKVGSFFLLPLYTAFLSTEDYGTMNLVATFQGVMGYIVTLCMMHAVMRFYADVNGDRDRTATLFGTIIIFVFLSGLAWIAVLLLCRPLLERYIFTGIDFFPIVVVGVAALPGNALYLILTNVMRAMERARDFSLTSLSFFGLMVASNVLLVVVLGLGALGIVLTTFVLNTLYSVILIFDLRRRGLIAFRMDTGLLKKLVSYSAPLLPHNLSLQISVLVSSVLINKWCSLGALGLYSLANQFGQVADTIQTSVNTAYQPWFYRKLIKREASYQSEIARLSSDLLWVFGFCFLCLALFSKEAIYLFTSDSYHEAWVYVPIMVGVFTLKTPYYFFIDVLYFLKDKTGYVFIASVTSSLVNIGVTFIAVPQLGVIGSMVADLVGTIVLTYLVVFLSSRFDHVGYKWLPFIRYSLLTLGLMAAAVIPDYFINGDGLSWLIFAWKLVLVGFYVGLAAYSERDFIRARMHKRIAGRGNGGTR